MGAFALAVPLVRTMATAVLRALVRSPPGSRTANSSSRLEAGSLALADGPGEGPGGAAPPLGGPQATAPTAAAARRPGRAPPPPAGGGPREGEEATGHRAPRATRVS